MNVACEQRASICLAMTKAQGAETAFTWAFVESG